MRLEGKVAIVTGSSRGIGRAIAESFAKEGAITVVNYSQSKDEAEEVVGCISDAGGKATAIKADISNCDETREMFRTTVSEYGSINILVNNAARFSFGSIAETTEEDFDKVFALNARGAFFAMQNAAQVMSDGGRIISVSTGATTLGMPFLGPYLGSKAALEEFGMVLANELGSRQITVNTVLAGATQTKMFDDLFEFWPAEARDQLVARTPLGRVGSPRDVAEIVVFLATDEARWVTGQCIRADGGLR